MKESVSQFRDQGYCVERGTDESFRAAVRRALAAAERWVTGGDPSRLNWRYEDGSFKHFMNPHECDASFRAIMTSPTVRNLVRALFGKQPMLVTHAKVSYKMAGKEQDWQPHQDSGYNPRPTVGGSICVFLERCDRSNGTLEVVPGSHRLGSLPHERIRIGDEVYEQLRVAQMPDTPPVAIEGDAGDVLVFDRGTIHLSGANSRGGYRSILIFEIESFTLRSLAIHRYPRWHMMFNADCHRVLAALAPGVVAVSWTCRRIGAVCASHARKIRAYGRAALARIGKT